MGLSARAPQPSLARVQTLRTPCKPCRNCCETQRAGSYTPNVFRHFRSGQLEFDTNRAHLPSRRERLLPEATPLSPPPGDGLCRLGAPVIDGCTTVVILNGLGSRYPQS